MSPMFAWFTFLAIVLPVFVVLAVTEGEQFDWDEAVRRYSDIRVAMTVKPDRHDLWHATVSVTGGFKGGESRPGIYSTDLRPRRQEEAAWEAARECADKLRSTIAAAQVRKMRTRTEEVAI